MKAVHSAANLSPSELTASRTGTSARIELNDASVSFCRTEVVGEFGLILASLLRFFDYLITLSALTNTLGGIVRPICFAALRLIINSNFVGCSTGRSAGFAPFRILST